MRPCQGRDRGFESRRDRHKYFLADSILEKRVRVLSLKIAYNKSAFPTTLEIEDSTSALLASLQIILQDPVYLSIDYLPRV